MADRTLPEKDTSSLETRDMGQEVKLMMTLAENTRKHYARHWYDNNFFDEGQHFRFISRTTGRIVDLSEKATLYTPKRAIPKAARQIRGMANLILSQDFIPLIKPEKVNPYSFTDPAMFKQMYDQKKETAKKVGYWLTNEWENQDMEIKLIQMVLNTLKHGVSFMQVWPDAVEEKIRTQVYDAFDIYLLPYFNEIYQSPFIIKAAPRTIREIKANENFDQEALGRITPDNKYASDEIKEAYLASKFGQGGQPSDSAATLIECEAFIKEYLNDSNWSRVSKQDKGGDILQDKKKGDVIIRHVFVAGQVTLYDKYENLPDYPFVDYRIEPGQIYQTPQIERFIPANKSLDTAVSRIERFIHTMDTGVWLKRKGEGFKISNVAGGLIAEYEQTPPTQMPIAQLGNDIYNFTGLMEKFIEEQGVSTSALGNVPKGVKAWGAIESLKASEFSNLHIPIKQLKKTIQKISEKMLDIADSHFVSPQTVYHTEKQEPMYFDVMGKRGVDTRQQIGQEVPEDIVTLDKNMKVDIEVESGLGYTDEGKKGRMMEIAQFVLSMTKAGLVNPQATKLVVERLLDVYKYGPTAEIMEALDQVPPAPVPLSPEQTQQIKVAFLEVIKDLKGASEGESPAPQEGGSNAVNAGQVGQGGI